MSTGRAGPASRAATAGIETIPVLLPRKPLQRGWTLVEMMVVLCITLVLAAMAIPSLRGMLNRQRLLGMAQQLQTDVQQARALAVWRQAGVQLRFARLPTGSGYVLHYGQPGDCQLSATGLAQCPNPALLIKHAWWPQRAPTSLSANVSGMSFAARQGAVTPTGSIELKAEDGTVMRQIVGISGRVRSCSPDSRLAGLPAC